MAIIRTTSAAWRPKLGGERNISRMEYGRTRGWWVRIYRGAGGNKRCHSKLFSDTTNGGKRAALRAARAWRDLMLARLPEADKHSGRRVEPGHGYVRRTVRLRRVAAHPVYVAWLRIEYQRCKSTNYSVTLHGEGGAREMAERWLARERRALRARLRGTRRAA
jgi:hypothetical protein